MTAIARFLNNMLLIGVVLVVTSGCDSSNETGDLGIAIWGEAYIESGIPVTDFADGWSVAFDKFLVNVGAISVGSTNHDDQLQLSGFYLCNLATTAGPMGLGLPVPMPTGPYDVASYTIAPASAARQPATGNETDLQFMIDNNYSVYVEGTARKASDQVRFEWGFQSTARYIHCQPNAVISENEPETVEITIHGDHLFYDSAVSESPNLRFTDIAQADMNGDHVIQPAELAQYDITPLPYYISGNLNLTNLWDYLGHMVTTLGHIDGEGHCEVESDSSYTINIR